jgi:hypothetical protein
MLNGLITNDKFCLSRFGRLALQWPRSPLHLRAASGASLTASLGEEVHQGGSHETAVARAASELRPPRRAPSLGSRLPGAPSVGRYRGGQEASGGWESND